MEGAWAFESGQLHEGVDAVDEFGEGGAAGGFGDALPVVVVGEVGGVVGGGGGDEGGDEGVGEEGEGEEEDELVEGGHGGLCSCFEKCAC